MPKLWGNLFHLSSPGCGAEGVSISTVCAMYMAMDTEAATAKATDTAVTAISMATAIALSFLPEKACQIWSIFFLISPSTRFAHK